MAGLETSIPGMKETRRSPETGDTDLRRRATAVRAHARRFMTTLVETKASSAQEISEFEEYFGRMKLEEDGYEGIADREVFLKGYGEKMERDAIVLHTTFMSEMNRARSAGLISDASKQKWIDRFDNKAIGFKAKEYWVYHQLGHYVRAWEKAAAERETLLKDPEFAQLISLDPRFAEIKDKETFLSLHFEKKVSLLAEARAAILASNKMQLDLFATAKKKLLGASGKGLITSGSVGGWLERIFKSNADVSKIEAFVHGTGKNTLADLMLNWYDVRKRYDGVAKNFKETKEDNAPRGLDLLTPNQFLSLHYTQRLRYVEEMEHRLTDSPDPDKENPLFLQIRHAIDIKDWEEADLLIAEAKKTGVGGEDVIRLRSMERYVTQFKGKEKSTNPSDVTGAKNRLDHLMDQLQHSHSEMAPLVLRLLKGPHPNLAIHQLRWIAYNNIWCRTNGPPYLDNKVAREGSKSDAAAMTKYRAEQGLDIGRTDSLDYATADGAYFRKQETSKHKATFLHTNMSSGGVVSALAEKIERPQHPSWLYWTTLCPHVNGEPKPEGWMREFLLYLTEFRSLSRTIETAGFRYRGPGQRLDSLN